MGVRTQAMMDFATDVGFVAAIGTVTGIFGMPYVNSDRTHWGWQVAIAVVVIGSFLYSGLGVGGLGRSVLLGTSFQVAHKQMLDNPTSTKTMFWVFVGAWMVPIVFVVFLLNLKHLGKFLGAGAARTQEEFERYNDEKAREKAAQNDSHNDSSVKTKEAPAVNYDKPVGSIRYYLDAMNGEIESQIFYEPRHNQYRLKIPKLGWDDIYSNASGIDRAVDEFTAKLTEKFRKKYPKFEILKIIK